MNTIVIHVDAMTKDDAILKAMKKVIGYPSKIEVEFDFNATIYRWKVTMSGAIQRG